MTAKPSKMLQFFRRVQPWPTWNSNCTFLGMQPRTRSTKFVRFMVEAATVRPMLSALLEMKRTRVYGAVVAAPVQPSMPMSQPMVADAPLKAA